jgi:hypothetical protein
MRMLTLLLLMLPVAVQALDYEYTVNGDYTITITNYTGDGGAVTIPNWIYGHWVTGIGDWAFSGCASLTSVTIPNSVTNIRDGAFYYCASLTNVSIPNSVNTLRDYVFGECASLTSITIPNSVTSIGGNTFVDDGLTSVTIPNSVTIVGDNAFANCTSLTSITIPGSVTNVGDSAFATCTSLLGIYFMGNPPDMGGYVFEGTDVIVYYMPRTTGWDSPFAERPAVLWDPQVQTSRASFGVRTNRFGFNITGTNDFVIVVEACTNLAKPSWSPVGTNTLTGGLVYFSDSAWTNYPRHFYRLRWP